MPLKNFGSSHFDESEKQTALSLLAQLQRILQPKLVILSPQERQRFGSVNEKTKLFVDKVYDYYRSQPHLASPDVDWSEFAADYQNRRFLQTLLSLMQSMSLEIRGTKILHDFDNYKDSLTDYAYTQYKSQYGSSGAVQKEAELQQFFRKKRKRKSENNPPSGEEEHLSK